MDELYRAKLTAEAPNAPAPVPTTPAPPPKSPKPDPTMNILPVPNPTGPPGPIHLHFDYPPPPQATTPAAPTARPVEPTPATDHHKARKEQKERIREWKAAHDAAMKEREKEKAVVTAAAPAPDPPPPVGPPPAPPGLWGIPRPHPMLWLCLALSLLALVLGVPKGTLPTITGRHKALRQKERLVNERLQLLNQLSGLLPPPIAGVLSHSFPQEGHHITSASVSPFDGVGAGPLNGWRFWNPALAQSSQAQYVQQEDVDKWWSVQELGDGASLVKSKDGDREREVWVIKTGGEDDDEHQGDKSLMTALTHSLLMRDQLLNEIAHARIREPHSRPDDLSPQTIGGGQGEHEDRDEVDRKRRQRDEWSRDEAREVRKRQKERERVVDEREREVARREQWVLEEMRVMSEKVHAQASGLAFEERIADRLKAYQRQLAHLEEKVNDKDY